MASIKSRLVNMRRDAPTTGASTLSKPAGASAGVWGRNPPSKQPTDEELKSKGIHLTDRLSSNQDETKAKWADLDDDDDRTWLPRPVEEETNTDNADTSAGPKARRSPSPTYFPAQDNCKELPELRQVDLSKATPEEKAAMFSWPSPPINPLNLHDNARTVPMARDWPTSNARTTATDRKSPSASVFSVKATAPEAGDRDTALMHDMPRDAGIVHWSRGQYWPRKEQALKRHGRYGQELQENERFVTLTHTPWIFSITPGAEKLWKEFEPYIRARGYPTGRNEAERQLRRPELFQRYLSKPNLPVPTTEDVAQGILTEDELEYIQTIRMGQDAIAFVFDEFDSWYATPDDFSKRKPNFEFPESIRKMGNKRLSADTVDKIMGGRPASPTSMLVYALDQAEAATKKLEEAEPNKAPTVKHMPQAAPVEGLPSAEQQSAVKTVNGSPDAAMRPDTTWSNDSWATQRNTHSNNVWGPPSNNRSLGNGVFDAGNRSMNPAYQRQPYAAKSGPASPPTQRKTILVNHSSRNGQPGRSASPPFDSKPIQSINSLTRRAQPTSWEMQIEKAQQNVARSRAAEHESSWAKTDTTRAKPQELLKRPGNPQMDEVSNKDIMGRKDSAAVPKPASGVSHGGSAAAPAKTRGKGYDLSPVFTARKEVLARQAAEEKAKAEQKAKDAALIQEIGREAFEAQKKKEYEDYEIPVTWTIRASKDVQPVQPAAPAKTPSKGYDLSPVFAARKEVVARQAAEEKAKAEGKAKDMALIQEIGREAFEAQKKKEYEDYEIPVTWTITPPKDLNPGYRRPTSHQVPATENSSGPQEAAAQDAPYAVAEPLSAADESTSNAQVAAVPSKSAHYNASTRLQGAYASITNAAPAASEMQVPAAETAPVQLPISGSSAFLSGFDGPSTITGSTPQLPSDVTPVLPPIGSAPKLARFDVSPELFARVSTERNYIRQPREIHFSTFTWPADPPPPMGDWHPVMERSDKIVVRIPWEVPQVPLVRLPPSTSERAVGRAVGDAEGNVIMPVHPSGMKNAPIASQPDWQTRFNSLLGKSADAAHLKAAAPLQPTAGEMGQLKSAGLETMQSSVVVRLQPVEMPPPKFRGYMDQTPSAANVASAEPVSDGAFGSRAPTIVLPGKGSTQDMETTSKTEPTDLMDTRVFGDRPTVKIPESAKKMAEPAPPMRGESKSAKAEKETPFRRTVSHSSDSSSENESVRVSVGQSEQATEVPLSREQMMKKSIAVFAKKWSEPAYERHQQRMQAKNQEKSASPGNASRSGSAWAKPARSGSSWAKPPRSATSWAKPTPR